MPSPSSRRSRRALTLVLSQVLALGVVSALAAPVQAADRTPHLTPAGRAGSASAAPAVSDDYEAGRYVVVLRDRPAAAYTGGLAGLRAVVGADRTFAPRSARTAAYVDHLDTTQSEVASSVGVTPLASYTLTTNGFAADLSAKQAARLAADPRVSAVVENEILQVADDTTSTGYLGLEGDDGVWEQVGGAAEAGKGIVVGVVDTGIAPENPSFAGDPLDTVPGAAPYRDGSTIVFHKSDGTDFHGTCQTGEQFTATSCSTKIVGARYFVAGFGTGGLGDASTGEYVSPRDGEAHGSHTASTAAGDADIETGGPHISGVTPAAKIAVYKACWSGPNPLITDDDGCATADLLSAIDAAVADGVDVINYSIGGGSAQTTNSLTDRAFMSAASAGIFVAAAGGNAGPDSSTLDNASPWITTVAASTIPAPEGTVELGDGTSALGATVTVPAAGVSGALVDSVDAASGATADAALCAPGSLRPADVTGKIVLCDRGEIDRLAKSAEVARAGGIGMVLVNPSPSSTDVDAHSVPTVHVDAQYYDELHEYAGTAGATVILAAGNQTGGASVPTPQVAGFSSRGPVEADGSDLIKPDVAAPGVNILAATANAAGAAPTWGYMSGTSMASPHVAGLGALYLGANPHATPAEVKSALMTSATDTVDSDGAPAEEPFAQGNGQVTPAGYLDPGLLYLNDVDDWEGYLASIGEPTEGDATAVDGSDLNLASIGVGALAGVQTVVRTVTATRPGTWTASVFGLDGVEATVEPATLSFDEPGEQHTFTVTFERDGAGLGDFSTGYLTWTDGEGATARSSLAVRPVAFDAPSEVAGTGTDGTVDLVARVGDDADVPLVTEGLAHGSRVTGTGTVGGASHRYAVTVPDGASFARFDLDAADDTADLDLTVYRRTPSGNLSEVGSSATGSADERVDVTFVESGTYVVDIDFYAAGSGGDTALGYALTSYVVDPTAGAGAFTVDPSAIDGHVGDAPTITASWTGLQPGHYLGIVRFGETGVSTVVTVDAGADVPVEPGTPALTLDPDDTGWVGRGSDLRVTATGLTPGATYTATVDDDDEALRSGTAASDGRVDWMVTMTDDIATGSHTMHLSGDGVEVAADFRVTPIRLVDAYGFPMTAFNGKPFARLDITYSGHGDLRYEIASASSGQVYLTKQEHVGEVVGLPTWSISTPYAEVGADDVVGTITVVMPDGSDGPTFTTEPFAPDAFEPGTITFTPGGGDADIVDVDIVNNSWSSFNPMVRYTGCDGRYVVANGFLRSGESSQRWDLTGFTGVELLDQFDQVLASYTNVGPGRCDSADIEVAQNYWATASVTPHGDPTYDPDAPITLEVSNRYAAHSPGFDLAIGEGEEKFSQNPFFYEEIPTEEVEVQGPVVSRSVAVREGVAHWASSNWEAYIDPPGIQILATAWVDMPALTVADLTPATGSVVAGTARVEGGTTVGSLVRARTSGWKPAGVTLSYQWRRDGSPIAGATGPTYRLRGVDAGHRISVRVTGSRTGSTSAAATSPAVRVLRSLTATPKPRITGMAVVGHRLGVRTGAWKPGQVRLTVTWRRDGTVVGHGRHHVVRAADRGSRLTVVVTGHRPGYATVSRTSRAVRVR